MHSDRLLTQLDALQTCSISPHVDDWSLWKQLLSRVYLQKPSSLIQRAQILPRPDMLSIHGPSALYPRVLKDLSAQLLPRLRLIPEFRCWLPVPSNAENCMWSLSEQNTSTSQSSMLWHCLAQGPPLIILLDLIGSRNAGPSLVSKDDESTDSQAASAAFVAEFLRRVAILEGQGQLSFGEVFTVTEFLDGSCSGFIKVLKTMQRVLKCLEATYPNLYELHNSVDRQREDLFVRFNQLERNHLEDLREIKECVEAMRPSVSTTSLILEYLAIHIDRMIVYHEYIVDHLQSVAPRSTDSLRWNHLFGLKEHMFILGSGAYRSYCTQFFALIDFIDALCIGNEKNERLLQTCFELSQLLTFPVDHILSYTDITSASLEITHPIESPASFESLCSAHLVLLSLKDDILDVMRSKRTAYAKRFINNQTRNARLNTECLSVGELILDDCLRAEMQGSFCPRSSQSSVEITLDNQDWTALSKKAEGGSCVYAFLFEELLFLGRPLAEEEPPAFPHHDLRSCYPGGQWDLGPAIRGGGPFDVLCAISLAEITQVHRPDTDDLAINVTWMAGHEDTPCSTIKLLFYDKKHLLQWVRVLSRLAPRDSVLVHVSDITECDECVESPMDSCSLSSWQEELEICGRRTGSKARSWSLIARKDGALSSSLYLFTRNDTSEPSLFSALSTRQSRLHRSEMGISTSPRSLSSARSQRTVPVAEPLKSADAMQSIELVLRDDAPPDLTGQVRRIGSYPAAHGGFSDVWKCNWISGSQCYKVAVKVLRGKLLDVEREDKMAKRLQHEIKVWQRLDHENVVPLLGTCSDFGRYLSLVCPWYENGSLYTHMRKRQDELKLHDRLRLLSEIAAGLSYLHSCSVVHGDLSSANILINDNGQASLCDFGLSTLVEDLIDSAFPSSMLGGAIRWSAPELYSLSYHEHTETRPRVSVASDIYSYGSIALEILSGKVPYHYLKHDGQVLIELSKKVKPQRTTSPFLTNDLWEFIAECWNDNPGERPSTMTLSSRIRLLHQRTLARHSM